MERPRNTIINYACLVHFRITLSNSYAIYFWRHYKTVENYGFLFNRFIHEPWFQYIIAYGGIFFDLMIVPFLLIRKTRRVAVITMINFHLFNFYIVRVGIFAWFMLAMTLIMLPPHWPRYLISKLKGIEFKKENNLNENSQDYASNKNKKIVLLLLGIFVIIQLLIPLRRYLYPGNPQWTENGLTFSWAMRSSNKRHKLHFYIIDYGRLKKVAVQHTELFTIDQFNLIATDPDKIQQAAQYVAYRYMQKHPTDRIAVKVNSYLGLNGRKKQRFIDPEFNLLSEPRSFGTKSWVLPFIELTGKN